MLAATSTLVFEQVAASTLTKALPFMVIGLLAIAIYLLVYPRVAYRLSPSVLEAITGAVALVVLLMFALIVKASGWLWAFIYAAMIAIWYGANWWINASRRAEESIRATMPKCPYFRSIRISTQPNVTTAICLDCGHALHIEHR